MESRPIEHYSVSKSQLSYTSVIGAFDKFIDKITVILAVETICGISLNNLLQ